MHPRAFQLLRGVSMQPFFAEPDDQGGGAPADPAPADPPADPAPTDPADPPADPAPADPAPADPAPSDPAPPEPPKRTDWRQGRMDTLTARAKAAEEREAAAAERARLAEERAAAYEALYGKPEGEPAPAAAPAATPTIRTNDKGERLYTQAELDAAAAAVAETNRLNEKLETMFDAGAAAHGEDWKTRVNAAGQAFGDQLKTRPDFWQAMTKLPNATDVYHQLAGDLDHLNEVLAMSPVDLGMELAKLSTAAAAKPKGAAVSRVAAPITPIEAVSEADVDLSKADMKTYAQVRDEQMAARHAQKYR